MEDGPGIEARPSAYCRKFSTETGARSLNSSTVMSPSEVAMTTTGLPGAGVAGGRLSAGNRLKKDEKRERASDGGHSDPIRISGVPAGSVRPDSAAQPRSGSRPDAIQLDGSGDRNCVRSERSIRLGAPAAVPAAGCAANILRGAHASASASREIHMATGLENEQKELARVHPRGLEPRPAVLRQLLRRERRIVRARRGLRGGLPPAARARQADSGSSRAAVPLSRRGDEAVPARAARSGCRSPR